jgi:tight adherence protein C
VAGLLPVSRELAARLDQELKRAGYYRPLARQQFLAVRNAMAVGWVLLAGTAAIAAYDPDNDRSPTVFLVGLLLAVLFYALPRLVLQSQGTHRLKRIQTGLPDALDMITMCLTGGLPLQQSLERVGKDIHGSHPDLATELEIIRRQSDAHTMEHALTQFSQRIDVPEVKSLTALVAQTERLGTNVSTALKDYSDSLRRTHRQRAEERGNATSVKLLLPVALCLAPPVYILLLAPPLLELGDFVTRENRSGGILAPNDVNVPAALPAARRLAPPQPSRTAPFRPGNGS